MPLAGHGLRPPALRGRASRPQLKRDPLGGALPPHRHSFDNSFGTVSTGAPSGEYAEHEAGETVHGPHEEDGPDPAARA